MNDKKGKEAPLLSVISAGIESPIGKVKFSNLVKPFYYPNSPKIPRYSITVIFDPALHGEFLEGIESIEKNEGVDSIIKKETYKKDGENVQSGNVIIKFQTKEKIKTFLCKKNNPEMPVEGQFLEDEIPKDSKIRVVFEILRYTKKNPFKVEHGLSFKPTEIHWIEE